MREHAHRPCGYRRVSAPAERRSIIPGMASGKVVGRKEAAEILGVLQNNLPRDVPEMPEPLQRLSTGPIWLQKDVEELARARKKAKR